MAFGREQSKCLAGSWRRAPGPGAASDAPGPSWATGTWPAREVTPHTFLHFSAFSSPFSFCVSPRIKGNTNVQAVSSEPRERGTSSPGSLESLPFLGALAGAPPERVWVPRGTGEHSLEDKCRRWPASAPGSLLCVRPGAGADLGGRCGQEARGPPLLWAGSPSVRRLEDSEGETLSCGHSCSVPACLPGRTPAGPSVFGWAGPSPCPSLAAS